MAYQSIEIGTAANDGTGDTLRVGGDKINDNFVEIYIKCSLSLCEKRDNKGMYKKARQNEIKNFTGVNDDYDIPNNPDLIIDTETEPLDKNVKKIMDYLSNHNFR